MKRSKSSQGCRLELEDKSKQNNSNIYIRKNNNSNVKISRNKSNEPCAVIQHSRAASRDTFRDKQNSFRPMTQAGL